MNQSIDPVTSVAAPPSVYEGDIDLRVKNNSHTIAYEFISECGRSTRLRVLEVGCSTGYFGQALKKAGHEVWGVEISPQAAAVARQKLDRVFAGSVEEFFALPENADRRFDCITYGDVLEHLVDPVSILRQSMSHLTDHGMVVASIPNVAHLAVRLMLLEGRWEYSDRGILDRTHLRFFTRTSIVELFSEAGYWIEAIAPVRVPSELTGISVNAELAKLAAPRVTDDAVDIFQYVVLARPASAARPVRDNERLFPSKAPNVLCLTPVRDWSIGDIRLRNPLNKWADLYGGAVRVKCIWDYTNADAAWADVVVMQREASPFILGLIDEFHRRGKRVVFDIDDLLTEVPEFLATHAHHQRTRRYLEQALATVDAVTTTTARLRDRLASYQDRIFLVPNCSALPPAATRPLEAAGTPVTLLVASSDTTRVEMLASALSRLARDPALDLRIVGIGPPGKIIAAAGVPVQCVENLPYDEFLVFVASQPNAIGLISLDESVFSSCKSAIKFLDYSVAGVVSICSKVPPYVDVVEDDVNGLLVENTVDAWCDAIRRLALSPQTRTRLLGNARSLCAERYSLRHAGDAWQQVLSDTLRRAPTAPAGRFMGAKMLTIRRSVGLLSRPDTYRSAFRVLAREGWRGVRKRITRLYS